MRARVLPMGPACRRLSTSHTQRVAAAMFDTDRHRRRACARRALPPRTTGTTTRTTRVGCKLIARKMNLNGAGRSLFLVRFRGCFGQRGVRTREVMSRGPARDWLRLAGGIDVASSGFGRGTLAVCDEQRSQQNSSPVCHPRARHVTPGPRAISI